MARPIVATYSLCACDLDAGQWGVVYSPALIWPELVNGNQLYMVPFVPDRGTIYDGSVTRQLQKMKARLVEGV